ncbi:MAG: hypothetical protein KJ042_03890 [Deltaproteobacteria bacterium]|nr:hypothetical protein [Deltaproteobacteria bacterium]
MKRTAVAMVIFCGCFLASRAIAQEPAASAVSALPPWCVLSIRPAMGGGAGSMTTEWDVYDGTLNFEEAVEITGVSHTALIPEAFFMPTAGRGFTISASLPFGGGSGTATSDNIFRDYDFAYRFVFLNVGLGYQFYFGAEKRANLALMSHLGFGRTQFTVDFPGDTATSKALGGGDFDLSVGSWYRFRGGFTLGGSLDYWVLTFSGDAGDEGPIATTVSNGGMGGVRLNALIGYGFE